MRRLTQGIACLALTLALAGATAAASMPSPNIIVKVKGVGSISNSKEPKTLCITRTCKFVLGKGKKLTLTGKPGPGYVFKSWDGPCISTHGAKCSVKGSGGKENFVAHFSKS